MSTETFKNLEKIHDNVKAFFSKLDVISQVDDKLKLEILAQANALCSQFNGAYGEYSYLYAACARNFEEKYQDFWDRIEKKGDYANED